MAILRNFILPLLASLFLTGCYETTEVYLYQQPVLCLNALVTPGEPINVSVTRTWRWDDPQGGDTAYVDDATITIKANGSPVTPDYLPAQGDFIEIQASSPRWGQASGSVTVPRAVPIESINWKGLDERMRLDQGAYYNTLFMRFALDASVNFNDPANVDNYYNISWYTEGPDTSSQAEFSLFNLVYEAEPLFGEHLDVFTQVTGGTVDGYTFFTDRQIAGKPYSLKMTFKDAYFTDSWLKDSGAPDTDCSITFTLNTLSESYYKWCLYQWCVTNGLNDFSSVGLGQPVWGYSNVSTGAGIIAATTPSTYTIHLSDYLNTKLSTP